jgi:hypothetical protein
VKEAELLKAVDGVVDRVVELRGLPKKAAIERGVSTREEIVQYLRENIDEVYREEDLQREEWLLKKLGLIPATMDYKEFTIELLTEQVGGYYDPKRKTFFVADWLPIEQQLPVMAHELTHALQDQHFDLEQLMERDRRLHNEDRLLAHQAIIEGDAVAVMFDYILLPLGRTFAELPDMTLLMQLQLESMNSQFKILESAPDFLKETLLFPYSYGPTFLKKIRTRDPSWAAVNKIYADLPASTEQIIHPEKYLEERDDPTPVDIEDPVPELGEDWKTSYKNVLGEFSYYLLLKLHLPEGEARRAAAGWDGDQILLLEKGSGEKRAVFAASVWDTEEEAEEFYLGLLRWLETRFPDAPKQKDDAKYSLSHQGERHGIQRDGLMVQFVVGLPEGEVAGPHF